MRSLQLTLALLALVLLSGCPGVTGTSRNPFLTATESYGASLSGSDEEGSGSVAATVDVAFRQTMTVTLANHHPSAELNTSFAAWVSPSSIRSGEQQDELLANGYVQLDSQVQIGTAYTLVPGTFVYCPEGTGISTSVRLAPTREDIDVTDAATSEITTERVFEIVTPDVILVYSEPPVSCESLAFYFTVDGDPLTSEGLTNIGNIYAGPESPSGGLKTLAQVDAYECDPFQPGLFLYVGGGTMPENAFYEGQDVRFDFLWVSTAAGDFGVVTLTGP